MQIEDLCYFFFFGTGEFVRWPLFRVKGSMTGS